VSGLDRLTVADAAGDRQVIGEGGTRACGGLRATVTCRNEEATSKNLDVRALNTSDAETYASLSST